MKNKGTPCRDIIVDYIARGDVNGLYIYLDGFTFKALKTCDLFLTGITTDGNKKLVNTPDSLFIIWNIPAVKTCPYATASCEKLCYAKRAEIAYPPTKKQRERNFDLSLHDTLFPVKMIYTVVAHFTRPALKSRKNIFFRIHESGDFYSQKYTDNILTVIDKLQGFMPGKLHINTYTKSCIYFYNTGYYDGKYKNFVLFYSLWADSKLSNTAMAVKMNLPVYTAGTENAVNAAIAADPDNNKLCRCECCATCQLCLIPGKSRCTFCVIH